MKHLFTLLLLSLVVQFSIAQDDELTDEDKRYQDSIAAINAGNATSAESKEATTRA